jgi:hypothetical protein
MLVGRALKGMHRFSLRKKGDLWRENEVRKGDSLLLDVFFHLIKLFFRDLSIGISPFKDIQRTITYG